MEPTLGEGGVEKWKDEILVRYSLVSLYKMDYMGRAHKVSASVTHAQDKMLY